MFRLFIPRCRQWPSLRQNNAFPALFSTTAVLSLNRKLESKIRTPSKKALAAKTRRRAALAAKADARFLKLPLREAIGVLRVSPTTLPSVHSNDVQAVEVASPNSLYELVIKTELGNGTAVPRGRVNLPREAKPRAEDKILVFAEGRLADEARKAGAHIVGGLELADGVWLWKTYALCVLTCYLYRSSTTAIELRPSSVPLSLSEPSPRNSVVSWVHSASCLLNVVAQ
jgi:large subunit ribosomal protein L1